MRRYYNRESALVLLACLVVGIGGALAFGMEVPRAIGLGVVFAVLAFFPLATALQDKLVEVYAGRGNIDRALELAIAARDSAPSAALRSRAQVDVALLHLLRRDYVLALENLERIKLSMVKSDTARAVVEGHLAYCLAHLGRDLQRAEEHARAAVRLVPSEPMFTYFLGLVLLQANRAAEAEPLIAQSLERNGDAQEPYPGERAWALARARVALGRDPGPARDQALGAGGHFAEQTRALAGGAQS